MLSRNKKQNQATGETLTRIALIGVLMLATGAVHAGTATRTSSFAYDPNTGLLTQEVIEPDTPALRLQTDYTYDAYGNKLTVTVSGADITTRTTSTSYDSNGQFPVTTTNALRQSDSGTYDARFGVAASLTGPNGLTTTWSYDGFGRKVVETRADGTQTNVVFNACDATCPSLAKYYIVTTTAGSPTRYAYYDLLNRTIRVQAQGFDGRLVTRDTQYDSLGRVSQTSLPYYAGDTVYWTTVSYDQLNRPVQETRPDGSTNQTAYNGLTTVSTNALGQTQTKVKNSQGQLVSATDTQGNVVSYQYDPFGNLTKTTDSKGNVTSLTYDLRGRKIAMSDPDMGNWSYQYNVLGQLIKQTDAKNQIVTMSYDLLGRMVSRSEPDLISTWTYDTAAKGVGKLATVTSDNGFKRVYTYDSFGRVASETSTIDTTYTVSKSYDAYGRVSVLTYPTGVAIQNVYNAYGYLSEVHNNATGALFWKGNAQDANGHILNETLGNGLTTTRTYSANTGRVQAIATNGRAAVQNQSFSFDALGNLTARFDSIAGFTETFAYDSLNRLITATQGGATTTVSYDSIGNITGKSDAGTYTYAVRPHAVTQVAGTLNASYTYDASGNLVSGAGRAVTYTSYNLPGQITTSTASVSFLYDADHTRIRQVSASETMIYLNPRIDTGMHFEKQIKNGVTEYKHYIYGGSGVVGVYTTSTSPAIAPYTNYFHQDHLGSIVAVTDDSGAVVARYAFDPWGKRLTLAGDPLATHHGFTGHEELVEVGLIHMNGRVYDPVLGRFMSADPYIQTPDNLQSYNRYAYVWNNPLSGTDPSGYWSLGKWFSSTTKAIFFPSPRNVFNSIRNQPGQARVDQYIMTHQWAYAAGQAAATLFTTAVCGGCGGAAWSSYYTYESTGSLNAAYRSAAIAYVTQTLSSGVDSYYGNTWSWERVAVNSAVGGINSRLSGGSFEDGFKTGFGFSVLTYANYSMRQVEIAQSRLNPSNANGVSGGFFEDHFKLAGARITMFIDRLQCVSSAGGCQGQPILKNMDDLPNILGFRYQPNGALDRLAEAFAGPHDWMRDMTGAYMSNGNSVYFAPGSAGAMWDSVKLWGEIPLAAPFAVGALITTTPGVRAAFHF